MSSDGTEALFGIGVLVVIAIVALCVGCTDKDTAARVLLDAGYTDVQITGWKPASCSDDDWYATGFSAKGPAGRVVKGSVCSGLLIKNNTIRTE